MIENLAEEIVRRGAGRQRLMVGIAGPPGSGKSTAAEQLVRALPLAKPVPMDGFHYDNRVLDELGLRGRKGAPETFDFAGYWHMLERLRRVENDVAVPVFDRVADLARAGAALIRSDVKYVISEGNYLLLDEAPWTELAGIFDFTVFLNAPRQELRRRLMKRWLDLDYSLARAEHWTETNDLPNVDRVLAGVRKADFVFCAQT